MPSGCLRGKVIRTIMLVSNNNNIMPKDYM